MQDEMMEDLEATAKSAKKSLEILDQAGIEFDEVRVNWKKNENTVLYPVEDD
jgi:hypothetical protein